MVASDLLFRYVCNVQCATNSQSGGRLIPSRTASQNVNQTWLNITRFFVDRLNVFKMVSGTENHLSITVLRGSLMSYEYFWTHLLKSSSTENTTCILFEILTSLLSLRGR